MNERAAVIKKIWLSVEQANAVYPAHVRGAKAHILFTTLIKPMLRAGKGTIQRAGTEYNGTNDGGQVRPGRTEYHIVISDYIRQPILDIMGRHENKLTDSANWLNLGLNSLQTITATRIFKRGLDFPSFTPNLIYLHSTVTDLIYAVLRLQQQQKASTRLRRRRY
ncbi:hypothetical protein BDV26DRAFT_291887 [Aspergillus bertholletiae]|uniref:Carrier domain-containing protein n=1 Tax=Aspergillus bertholletiae TaxID=1226010 RepID=A0A5N7BAH4_9EURO|nr:hypothetical protein BDV26DRAFT_291887 [Aspergillus bertholletiae]